MLLLVNHKGRSRAARQAIREAGGTPLVVAGPRQVIAEAKSDARRALRRSKKLAGLAEARSGHGFGGIGPAFAMIGRDKPAFTVTQADMAARLGHDAMERPGERARKEKEKEESGERPAEAPAGVRPASWNSAYMAGDCVVSIFLVQGPPPAPQWTDALETQVTAEVLEGLSWLAGAVNPDGAAATFILDWHRRQTLAYDPMRFPYWTPDGDYAAIAVLENLGYAVSHAGGDAFNAAQRMKFGADMAVSVFVVIGSTFPDGYSAYAWLGGPWAVLTTDNGGWGIGLFNRVLAHETGHLWGAGDLYAGSGMDASTVCGHLCVPNGADFGGSSLMSDLSLRLAPATLGQLGVKLASTAKDTTADALQHTRGAIIRRDALRVTDLAFDPALEPGVRSTTAFTVTNESLVAMHHVEVVGSEGLWAVAEEIVAGESVSAKVAWEWPSRADWPGTFMLTLRTEEGWEFHHEFAVALPDEPQEPDMGEDEVNVTINAPDEGERFEQGSMTSVRVDADVFGLPVGEHRIIVGIGPDGEYGTVARRRITVVAKAEPPAQTEWIVDDRDRVNFGVFGSGWQRGGGGSWANKGVFPGGFPGDGTMAYLFLRDWQGAVNDFAWWRFPGLLSGLYSIRATWVEGTTRSKRAPWELRVDDVPIQRAEVNQQEAPGPDGWRELWLQSVGAGRVLVPRLYRGTAGCVIADAVRIVRVGD